MTHLLLCLISSLAVFGPQAGPESLYLQTYAVFIRGVPSGTETVSESMDKEGNRVISSQHELMVQDGRESKRLAFETTMVLVKDTVVPMSYSFKYLSGNSKDYYEVKIEGGRITRVLSRGGNVSETAAVMQPGTVILDINVYHQYDLIYRLYDFKKGGRQLFSDFIPVIGTDLPLAVTWLEDSTLDYGKGSMPVRNFKIEFVGVRAGNFSTDMKGRLVRLIMRDQDLEVVRKDLVPEKQ
jgi:hypothetical protein